MIIRATNSTNDWLFGKGVQDYFYNEAAIEANIKTKLLEWVGNCYFNIPAGIDWKNRLGYGQQQALITEVKQLVLQCYGVTQVLNIEANFNAAVRSDLLTLTIKTIYSSSAVIMVTPTVLGVL